MPRPHAMYMHTLDGQPANFTTLYGAGLYFVGGLHRVTLVKSLRQVRREQRLAMAAAARDPNMVQWSNPRRYGYVLVEVPR